jgi:hypothetical protein
VPGNEIALDPNSLTFGVQTHSLYFVQVGGYGASTGHFQINYTEVPGSGTGLDFASAITVELSSAGSATASGVLGPLGSASVFQFQATVSGQSTVTLDNSSPGSLAAFTVSNGVPTQVGQPPPDDPDVMTFEVTLGQTYFVRVTSTGSGGRFSLDLQTTPATAPPGDIQLPGKATLVQLGQVYVTDVAAAGPSPSTASLITQQLVQTFVASQPEPLPVSYLLVWTDPVDFILTDSSARESGFTAGRGPLSEVGGSFNSGGGVLKMVILPLLSSSYDLELFGVGEGAVLFGAAEITAFGAQVDPQTSDAPALPVSLSSTADLVVVLGFNGASSPPPPPPSPLDDPNPPTTSSAPGPSTTASSAFLGGALSAQLAALIGGFSNASETSIASASALATAPSAVTAPPSSIVASAAEHSSHDELALAAPRNVPGQDVQAVAMALAAGLANGEFQGLSPRVRTIVQPIVRGLDSLGGRMWNILKSIITNLARPRVAGKRAEMKGAFFDRPDAGSEGISAVSSPARGGPLDPLLESYRQDTERLLMPVQGDNMMNVNGDVEREFIAFALFVTALGELRSGQSSRGRMVYQAGNAWRRPGRWRRPLDR